MDTRVIGHVMLPVKLFPFTKEKQKKNIYVRMHAYILLSNAICKTPIPLNVMWLLKLPLDLRDITIGSFDTMVILKATSHLWGLESCI